MTKKLTIALFSASMIALSATSLFAQDGYVGADGQPNAGPAGKTTRQEGGRPLSQGFREHFAAMPTADGRTDLQIDRARPPAQAAQ
jgi:hypothetical protein